MSTVLEKFVILAFAGIFLTTLIWLRREWADEQRRSMYGIMCVVSFCYFMGWCFIYQLFDWRFHSRAGADAPVLAIAWEAVTVASTAMLVVGVPVLLAKLFRRAITVPYPLRAWALTVTLHPFSLLTGTWFQYVNRNQTLSEQEKANAETIWWLRLGPITIARRRML